MFGRMPLWIRFTGRIGALLLLGLPAAANENIPGISNLCVAAAHRAANQTSVPFAVLLAIARTETGRAVGDDIQPWPWALNVAGEGHWLATRSAALDLATRLEANGKQNFDVGCFQLNYRWHGQHFASLDHMLDPDAGAAYAASFLERLYRETGDWSAAAGTYHSRTPRFAARYRQRFDALHQAARAVPTPVAIMSTRVNSFPLLRSSGARAVMGSLVPISGDG